MKPYYEEDGRWWNNPLALLGAIIDRVDMAPNDAPLPYIREYIDGLRERIAKERA